MNSVISQKLTHQHSDLVNRNRKENNPHYQDIKISRLLQTPNTTRPKPTPQVSLTKANSLN